MNHPIISSANGKARHNEMIQAADNYRRVKQLQQGEQSQPSYLTRFSSFLTSLFSKAGSSKTADPLAQTS
jgi:hypothetical protein